MRVIITYEFSQEDRDYAIRLAKGRQQGKEKAKSNFDAHDPLTDSYHGVLGEIAAAHRYGGYVNETFTGAKGDKGPDLFDSDGDFLEVKTETFQGADLYMKILPHRIFGSRFDNVQYVLVRLRPEKDPRSAEIFPTIHAYRVRQFGFYKDWRFGEMWNVPVAKILNQNEHAHSN